MTLCLTYLLNNRSYNTCLATIYLDRPRSLSTSNSPLRKKRPYSELLWSVFFPIRTEYREIRSISPYSVQNAGKYGPEKTLNLDTFDAVSSTKK